VTATPRRRRRAESRVPASSDEYQLRRNGTSVAAKYNVATLALLQAQQQAEEHDGAVEIRVVRKPLLGGQEHVAFRVVKNEDGDVLTYAEED
jgi:hypothetical protein